MRTSCSALRTNCTGRQDKRIMWSAVRGRYSTDDRIVLNVDGSMLLKLAIHLKLTTFAESAARLLCLFPHSMYVKQLVSDLRVRYASQHEPRDAE